MEILQHFFRSSKGINTTSQRLKTRTRGVKKWLLKTATFYEASSTPTDDTDDKLISDYDDNTQKSFVQTVICLLKVQK